MPCCNDYLPRSKQGHTVFMTQNGKTFVKLIQVSDVEVQEMCLIKPNIVENG